MTNSLSIPDELWSQVPPDAQAALTALFLVMPQGIHDLETRVDDLEARLKLNSNNSRKPPSSNFIGAKRKPSAPLTGKKVAAVSQAERDPGNASGVEAIADGGQPGRGPGRRGGDRHESS